MKREKLEEVILKNLVAFNTTEKKYNNAIKKYILSLFGDFQKKVFTVPETNNRAFVITINEGVKKSITFLMHLDTTELVGGWDTKPLMLSKNGEVLVGLGASDMKGGIACVLAAILENKPKLKINLIFTSNEETSVDDINKVAKYFPLQNELIVVPEPTNNNIGIQQKGVLEVKLSHFGRSFHAAKATSYNNQKYNSIVVVSRMISKISDFINSQNKNIKIKDGITVNFGKIQGGSAVNSAADYCELFLSVRISPNVDFENTKKGLLNFITTIDKSIKVAILLEGKSFSNINEKMQRNLQKNVNNILGGKTKKIQLDYWSEVAVISENNTCVVIGPGDIKQMHKANESIDINEMTKYKKMCAEIMKFIYLK